MAALLAVHGAMTPGVLVGTNGLIEISGAATLPVGAAILVLLRPAAALAARDPAAARAPGRRSCRRSSGSPSSRGASRAAPVRCPRRSRRPRSRCSPSASLLYGALGVRAARTFVLTRRAADLAVIVGLRAARGVGLRRAGAHLHAARLVARPPLRGWSASSSSAARSRYDLRRGRAVARRCSATSAPARSWPPRRHFLGARVRALMVRLAEKDTSTEEHTRRVAWLAVRIGEELGLAPARLRRLAIGGLLHDIGKLSTPTEVLQKPAALTTTSTP